MGGRAWEGGHIARNLVDVYIPGDAKERASGTCLSHVRVSETISEAKIGIRSTAPQD